jgi:hypothetical protein
MIQSINILYKNWTYVTENHNFLNREIVSLMPKAGLQHLLPEKKNARVKLRQSSKSGPCVENGNIKRRTTVRTNRARFLQARWSSTISMTELFGGLKIEISCYVGWGDITATESLVSKQGTFHSKSNCEQRCTTKYRRICKKCHVILIFLNPPWKLNTP